MLYIYGNYIDEVLQITDANSNDYYYVHDHLYSPAALANSGGTVVERYEYDAYGTCRIMDASYGSRSSSNYGNSYLFSGRRLDILDSGSLKIQYNRNRYYDCYTGRWLTHDQLGYVDGMNLYEYAESSPITTTDPWGLWIIRRYNWYGKALAFSQCNTFKDLADIVGLEHAQWKQWITGAFGVKTVGGGQSDR